LSGGKLPSGAQQGAGASIAGNGGQRVIAAVVLVIGVALFGNGIVQRVLV
jgi:hypothetical protein